MYFKLYLLLRIYNITTVVNTILENLYWPVLTTFFSIDQGSFNQLKPLVVVIGQTWYPGLLPMVEETYLFGNISNLGKYCLPVSPRKQEYYWVIE